LNTATVGNAEAASKAASLIQNLPIVVLAGVM